MREAKDTVEALDKYIACNSCQMDDVLIMAIINGFGGKEAFLDSYGDVIDQADKSPAYIKFMECDKVVFFNENKEHLESVRDRHALYTLRYTYPSMDQCALEQAHSMVGDKKYTRDEIKYVIDNEPKEGEAISQCRADYIDAMIGLSVEDLCHNWEGASQ